MRSPVFATVAPPFKVLRLFFALALMASLCKASDPPAWDSKRLESFVSSYCLKCHGGETAEADLRLDQYSELAAIIRDRARWEKVLDYLQAGLMPPEDEPRPSDEEIASLSDWLGKEFEKADASAPRDPGRVTIRRLNRAEYNNTVRDLLGVDFEPAKDFPTDEVGYGFDNIGDVLALPPALLEKYLAAAEQIADRAIVIGPLKPPVVKIEPGELQGKGASSGKRFLFTAAEVVTDQETHDGDYVFRIEAYGQQAGPEPARMALSVDTKNVQTFDVEAVEERPGMYQCRLHLAAGHHRIALAFVNDYWQPKDPDPNNRDRNLVIVGLQIEGPVDRAGEWPESHRRLLFRVPAENASREEQDDCAREILTRFVSRAYRRPAQKEEVERLVELVRLAQADDAPFERGVQLAVEAVLVSPHFLFRVELDPGPAGSDAIHPINDFELASRLSYFLWSTMPDEELSRVAGEGRLREPAVLEAQVRRMLADPRAHALVENFADQWLQIRNLSTVSPDPKQFPEFDPEMQAAMRTETEMFFETVMREDRSVLDLLAADFTFVNEKLAKHYGLEGVSGPEFRRVSLAGTQRGGLVTQASILTITSNPTRTSPVKRGRWILEQILGTPPPPPPAGVSELKDDPKMDQTASLRRRLEQHRQNPSCAACHKRMDPLGFGLENFDPIGAWRDKDGQTAIDATGELPDGVKFNGPQELRKILLAQAPRFRRCLAGKMLTYALGRGVERSDRRAVDKICTGLANDGDKFSRLILEIVTSEAFQMRRREASGAATAARFEASQIAGGSR